MDEVIIFSYKNLDDWNNRGVNKNIYKINWIKIIRYAIMAIFGRNIAWFYYSDDAMFHGNIRLRYFKYWLLMGILSEILYQNFLIKILP